MAENTKIEWAHHTFNPWIGCTKVGPGCDNCYAEADFDKRRHVVQWGACNPRKRTAPSNWSNPLAWNRRAERLGVRYRVFCASLADVFDNEVPNEWRADLWKLIEATPHLDWLLVTKRIGNVGRMIPDRWSVSLPTNVWLGITVTSQDEADRDIPKLLSVPAAVRFLSMEPLLGPVDLDAAYLPCPNFPDVFMDQETGAYECCHQCDYTGIGSEIGVDWVIVGGESGKDARPMHPEWARSLRDQCKAAGVPFLFKQWGEWKARDAVEDTRQDAGDKLHYLIDHEMTYAKVGKGRAGRVLDGRTHDGFPESAA